MLQIRRSAWLLSGCAAILLACPALAKPTLLFDVASGKVLYAEDQDDLWHPASLTKIMTAYLTFEALKTGKLSMDAKIPVSELAFSQPPSKVGLPVGAEMPVETAIQALIVKSANDVAIMLAEAIAGSQDAFVERMNATAARLGMTRTKFVNANGLPAAEQVTTARDLAKLSRVVLAEYPQYASLWGQADMHLGKRRLRTHNGLLKSYEGADGLKTGFICDSGYNVVASATRDGHRLIAVVLGEISGHERSVRAAALLEHGFNTYDWKTMLASASVDSMPMPMDVKPAPSMRASVVSWDCNGRHRPVAKRRQTKLQAARAAAKKARTEAAAKTKVKTAEHKAPEKVPKPAPAKAPASAKAN